MKTIYEAQDLRLRLHIKKVGTDWLFIILLILMLVFLTGWTLYITNYADNMVAVYPQGGWVATVVETNYWHSYCTTFPDKCVY